jgi:hypothetical protein
MFDANPFGEFSSETAPTGKCRLQLHIGNNPVQLAEKMVCTTSSGWLAAQATNMRSAVPHTNTGNMIGAIAAACLSGAQLFKLALKTPTGMLLRDGIFDMWSLQWTDAHISAPDPNSGSNLGRLLLIGAGSVGSSAAYWLRALKLGADLQIIDGDSIKVENFNRSPMFGRKNYGANKAVAVRDLLFNSHVQVHRVFPGWWHESIQQAGRPDADVWLPLANDFDVRWSMQNNYPPLMVHASTGSNWLANFGRHVPLHGDCLIDRFPIRSTETALGCSEGKAEDGGNHIDAALPFLSFFAGLLVAADLARLALPDYPQTPNFAAFDFGGPMSVVQAWNRQPTPHCICAGQLASVHQQINGGTRYAQLSPSSSG